MSLIKFILEIYLAVTELDGSKLGGISRRVFKARPNVIPHGFHHQPTAKAVLSIVLRQLDSSF
jgi:hypothetical protein